MQLRCFLGMIHEQRHLPDLKQLLKLYTTIPLPKLAQLLGMEDSLLRSQLMLLKVTAVDGHHAEACLVSRMDAAHNLTNALILIPVWLVPHLTPVLGMRWQWGLFPIQWHLHMHAAC